MGVDMKGFVSVTSFAGALCLMAALPSMAQEAAASETLEEVVVTAEFRTVDIQKTAINLTVVTQEDMLRRGIVDTRTMLDSIPGMDMTNANPNNYIGLYGTASAGGSMWSDGNMSFNYGGVPLARQVSAAAAMYDLERVEVLKGPQGTLYGRNATTGAVNLVLARPTAEYGGAADVTVGNYGTINTQGHLNLPISERVMTRFAFQTTRHDGYFTNGYDDANNMGFRGSVLFKASDDVSLLVWGDTFRNRAKGPTTTWRYYLNSTQEWIDPKNPWFGLGPAGSCANPLLCPSFAKAGAGGVNAQAPPPGANIASNGGVGDGFLDTSPTGEANYSVFGRDGRSNSSQETYAAEFSWHSSAGTLTALAARVNTIIDYDSYSNGLRFGNFSDVYQNSLEVRFANNATGKLKWLVGGFLYREHQNAFQYNMADAGYALLSTPNLTDDNYAAFGDATYSVTDAFRVSLGARYTSEEKKQDGYVTLNGVSRTPIDLFTNYAALGISCFGSNIAAKVNYAGYFMPSNFCVLPNGGKFKNTNTSGKLGLEWDVSSNKMAYFTAKQGFRSGGFTAGSETTYQPEKLMAYELGLRSRFRDDRLQLNASAFKWNYKDQQFSILHPFLVGGSYPVGIQTSYPYNVNGELHGLEADLQARVFAHDEASVTLLYAKGKLDSVPTLINSAGVQAAILDTPRVNLPTWTVNGSYTHRVPMSNGATMNLRADFHHESDAWMRQVADVNKRPGDYRNAFTKFNASIGYDAPDSKWSLTAFINNITDEAVPGVGSSGQVANGTFFKSPGNPADARSATLDPPRTYGLRISASF
jgi:iron complex outermembrane recepter protein